MAIVPAVVTEDARVYFPQMQAGLVPYKLINYFKVGEGGWIDPGGGAVARTPVDNLRRLDNSLQDIDAIVDTTRAALDQRYPADSQNYYGKTLTISDFSFISPNKLEIRCNLDSAEWLDDGYGNSPEIWEIGVFCDHPVVGGQRLMIAYGTFPMQTQVANPILNIVRLVY